MDVAELKFIFLFNIEKKKCFRSVDPPVIQALAAAFLPSHRCAKWCFAMNNAPSPIQGGKWEPLSYENITQGVSFFIC